MSTYSMTHRSSMSSNLYRYIVYSIVILFCSVFVVTTIGPIAFKWSNELRVNTIQALQTKEEQAEVFNLKNELQLAKEDISSLNKVVVSLREENTSLKINIEATKATLDMVKFNLDAKKVDLENALISSPTLWEATKSGASNTKEVVKEQYARFKSSLANLFHSDKGGR
jgi:regulator of replication initiation timing